MGVLLVGMAIIETSLFIGGRPLLSHQQGWKRAAVVVAGAALVAHVLMEGARDDAAAAAARGWCW